LQSKGEFFGRKVKDIAIENETLLAVKSFLIKKFKNSPVKTFSQVMYKNREIMEWDGVLT
jgi:hypothetical protein